MRALSLSAVQQCLICGKVIDNITGQAVKKPFSVQLQIQLSESQGYVPIKANTRILNGGYFVASGDPVRSLPLEISPSDTVDFRIFVSVPGFSDFENTYSLPASDVIPVSASLGLLSGEFDVKKVDSPLLDLEIKVDPLPVSLSGVVLEDGDASQPLEGVTIAVTSPESRPAVLSDVNGRFRIENLPVAKSVTLSVHLDEVSSDVVHVVDFATPLNTRTINLNG